MERFEDHKGIVHMQAMFGLKMAHNAGCDKMEYQDMYQEASLAFLMASEKFDPSAGFKFSAYFSMVAANQFKRTIGQMTGVKSINDGERAEIAERRAENKRRGASCEKPLPDMNYGLRPTNFGDVRHLAEDDQDFAQVLPSEAPTPEELLEHKQTLTAALEKLSPLSRLFVEWLREPPPELLRECEAREAHCDMLVHAGRESPRGMRAGVTFDAIALFIEKLGTPMDGADLKAVRKELRNFTKELTS